MDNETPGEKLLREIFGAPVERQPREHSVGCIYCRRPTLALDAVCGRCRPKHNQEHAAARVEGKK